ncbi:hypothetical protein NM688_g7837 [Phlebia brevispora]|uniref:Uncharacterized protein n=1 Tax=Phlebia brevispora TaxID=194682 RepID=A0ACC1S0R1_9APHY|nr:hypothetical protein NM688_g7837 [Phlebia brevispora]
MSTRLGPATQVPIQFFLDHVLPPLDAEIDTDAVLAKLRRYGKGPHRAITKAGRWCGFSVDPAKIKGPHSGSAFANWPRVVDAIARCGAPTGKCMKPSLRLVNNPSPGRDAEDCSVRAAPDAYMVAPDVLAGKTEVPWTSIAVIGEYETYASDKDDNVSKITRSISRAFEDPRRRFVFGFTIEDTAMRLWFCDRTQLIVSTYVNFITEHKIVVHTFLSLIYAEPHHLGWDSTIKLIEDVNKDLQYDFTVERGDGSTAVFRSLSCISHAGSKTVLSKGTRVWRVVSLVNGVPTGEPAVLKDEWVHEELEREGTTLQEIQQYDRSDEFQGTFFKSFLTALAHGDVVLRSPTGAHAPYCDRTRQHDVNARAYVAGMALPDVSLFAPRGVVLAHLVSVGENFALTGCRVHYRIVFKECCAPLTLSMPLHIVFSALGEVCEALKVMHRAGWVHRDVSIGNIMLDVTGRAKLVDLEYAKKMGDKSVPELSVVSFNLSSNLGFDGR